jgi:HAD superfamily hydrolase (TIGR01509 family)
MTAARKLRAVAFDLDGLMFNTEILYFEVGDEILRRRDKRFDNRLREKMMGLPGPVAFQVMIDHHLLTDSVEQLQQESSDIFAEILTARLAPMPGTMDLLAALETAEIPKCIATSSRRSFLDEVLAKYDLAERFDFFLTQESITHGKPHPEIYQKAAAQFDIDPHAMMVLEDSQNGCRAAVASGAYVVAVPGDHSRGHDFAGASLVADTLADRGIYRALGLEE